MSSPVDDATLRRYVQAAMHGDDVALGAFVRATQPVVARFCATYATREDAEDLTQEVFIRASRTLHRYRGECSALGWLLGIARHVCADQVRRNQRRGRLLARLRNECDAAPSDTAAADLRELIDALDPVRRDAFVMTQVLGLSYEEAAAACECPIGTIRSRVARARADLVEAVRLAEAR